MLRILGLGEGPQVDGAIGWGESVADGENVSVNVCYLYLPLCWRCVLTILLARGNPHTIPTSRFVLP